MKKHDYYYQMLTTWRSAKGVTRRVVANDLDCTEKTIYRAERGDGVSFDLLKSMCKYYGKSLSELIITK